MIKFHLNGELSEVAQSISIEAAIKLWQYNESSIAIAVNEVFIPKIHYQDTMIKNNDRIEVVGSMQGG